VIGPLIAAAASHFGLIKRIGVAAFDALKGAVQGFITIGETVVHAVETIVGALQSLYDKAKAIQSIIPDNPFSGGPGATAGRTARTGTQHRASGGPIMPGVPYIVGEHGPELRVFDSPGRILPNDQLGGPTVLYATIDLGKGIQQRIKLEFDGTARRVKAGTRYG
jgi:hypothetical protein